MTARALAVGALLALAAGCSRTESPPAPVAATRAPRVADRGAAADRCLEREAATEGADPERALDAYRAALAADPGLACVAYRIARFPDHGEVPPDERRRAIAGADGASLLEPARQVLGGWAARLEGRADAALEAWEMAASLAPGDLDPASALGEHLWHATRVEEALPWLLRASALDPGFQRHAPHLLEALPLLDRGDEALALARRAVELAPGSERNRRLLASMLVGAAAYREALQEVSRVASAHRDEPALTVRMLLGVLVPAGRLEEAETITRALAAGPERDRLLAEVLVRQGRVREALALAGPGSALDLEEARAVTARSRVVWHGALGERPEAASAARALERSERAGDVLVAGLALADAGAVEEAARLASRASELGARSSCPGDDWARCDPRGLGTLSAVLRFRSGPASARAAALAELAALGRSRLDLATCWHGALAAEAGRDAEAVEALRRCSRSAAGQDAVMGPRARFLAARSLARLGRPDDAREELAPVTAAWKHADRDLRCAREAMALAARLAPAVPAGAPP